MFTGMNCNSCAEKGALTDALKNFINCIMDGIVIIDSHGTVLMLNQASLDNCPYTEAELVGRNMREMIDDGMFDFDETVCFEVIETQKPFTKMQKNASSQRDLLATGTPYFVNGKFSKVIITERDLTDLNNLKNAIEAKNKYEDEVEYYRIKNFVQDKIIYNSKCIEDLLHTIDKVAPSDATVLFQGESGTGKSLFARLIYEYSERKKEPFIEISCAAIPDNLLESELFGYEKGAFTGALDQGKIGLFELANGGTLFLDEIGTLSLGLQAKILRAIQNREIMRIGGTKYIPIDVRIITATNIDLKEAVRQGSFRQDLYYRINVVPICIPPLRERRDCIRPLCEHFISLANKKYNRNIFFKPSAWKLICRYEWPGNIRELENMIERIAIISESDLVSGDSPLLHGSVSGASNFFNANAVDLKEALETFEENLLESKLPHFKTTEELAKALNMNRSTLSRRLKKYNLKL